MNNRVKLTSGWYDTKTNKWKVDIMIGIKKGIRRLLSGKRGSSSPIPASRVDQELLAHPTSSIHYMGEVTGRLDATPTAKVEGIKESHLNYISLHNRISDNP